MTSPVVQHIERHLEVISALKSEAEIIEKIGRCVIAAFQGGGRLYLFGNGGSADAQHIAAELVGRFRIKERRALPAFALTTDSSGLTALGNDFGFDQVFSRQLEACVQANDVCWALSVSGSSPNVIEGVKVAQQLGATTVGFTGRQGTQLSAICDHCLMVDHTDSDRVQEAHQLAYHIVCGVVEDAFV